jgi:hypothetical protein
MPMSFFQRNRQINHKIHVEAKKSPNSQSSPEQKEMVKVPQYLTSNCTMEPW